MVAVVVLVAGAALVGLWRLSQPAPSRRPSSPTADLERANQARRDALEAARRENARRLALMRCEEPVLTHPVDVMMCYVDPSLPGCEWACPDFGGLDKRK